MMTVKTPTNVVFFNLLGTNLSMQKTGRVGYILWVQRNALPGSREKYCFVF